MKHMNLLVQVYDWYHSRELAGNQIAAAFAAKVMKLMFFENRKRQSAALLFLLGL